MLNKVCVRILYKPFLQLLLLFSVTKVHMLQWNFYIYISYLWNFVSTFCGRCLPNWNQRHKKGSKLTQGRNLSHKKALFHLSQCSSVFKRLCLHFDAPSYWNLKMGWWIRTYLDRKYIMSWVTTDWTVLLSTCVFGFDQFGFEALLNMFVSSSGKTSDRFGNQTPSYCRSFLRTK